MSQIQDGGQDGTIVTLLITSEELAISKGWTYTSNYNWVVTHSQQLFIMLSEYIEGVRVNVLNFVQATDTVCCIILCCFCGWDLR